MKETFHLVLGLLMTLFAVQNVSAQSSFCEDGYMAFKEGFLVEMSSYDKKGKLTNTVTSKVISLGQTEDGYKAQIEAVVKDQKGKAHIENAYSVTCQGDVLSMDMSARMDPRTLASFSNMEVEISGEPLQIPNSLTPGQTLPDGTMTMKAKAGGISMMSMTMNIRDRKVGDRESITTPAGTFDCIQISEETEVKSIFKINFRTTSWYAKGIGVVKQESYDKKGNVESSTMLTKLEY